MSAAILNFRATAGFVTDNSGQTYVLASDTYPTSRIGLTFGWETPTLIDSRDRNSSVDPRLAGLHFRPNGGGTDTFRLDLSSGEYDIAFAFGDSDNDEEHYIDVKDNTSSLFSFSPLSTPTARWGDAAGNTWSASEWPTNNVAVRKTISSGILRVVVSAITGARSTTIANLSVTQVGEAPAMSAYIKPNKMRPRIFAPGLAR